MSRFAGISVLLVSVLGTAACDDSLVAPIENRTSFDLEPSAAPAAAGRTISGVFAFGEPPTPVDGNSSLTRNDAGVSYRLSTTALTPGNAYSLWLVIFNAPDGCTGDCGEDDLFNAAVMVDIVYGGGNVVGKSGRASFAGRRMVGDNSTSVFAALGAPAPGLMDAWDAEVHLIVRDHGPAIPGQIAGQIHTFEGSCTPESSFGLGAGPNACADVQFAVHLPQ